MLAAEIYTARSAAGKSIDGNARTDVVPSTIEPPREERTKKLATANAAVVSSLPHGGGQFADLAPPDDSATSNSCDSESDQPISDPSAHGGQPIDLADASATLNARSGESDQPTSVTSAPTPTSAEHSETTPPCRGWLLLEGVRLNEASVVNSPLLSYLQMVASCIEGRRIGRDELVQALLTTMRQRSLSTRPRTEYVLDYLNRHPP